MEPPFYVQQCVKWCHLWIVISKISRGALLPQYSNISGYATEVMFVCCVMLVWRVPYEREVDEPTTYPYNPFLLVVHSIKLRWIFYSCPWQPVCCNIHGLLNEMAGGVCYFRPTSWWHSERSLLDRDANFLSTLIEEICKLLNIKD